VSPDGAELTAGVDDAKFATALGIAGVLDRVSNQPGSYTLQLSDHQKTIRFTSSSGSSTCTLPNSFPVGFRCIVIQGCSSSVSFSAASGATRSMPAGANRTSAQYAQVALRVVDNSDGSHAVWYGDGSSIS
jgi:hypothetical protein